MYLVVTNLDLRCLTPHLYTRLLLKSFRLHRVGLEIQIPRLNKYQRERLRLILENNNELIILNKPNIFMPVLP